MCPGLSFADGLDTGNSAWIMTAAALVLFMTLPGLALFYSGMVRAKNALSIIMQCFGIACLVTVLWLIVAYSLAFSGDGAYVGDLAAVLFADMTVDSLVGTIPEPVFALFQLTFAIITVALIVGAFAERVNFSAVLIFGGLWLLFVYAPIAHWVWGGGWLSDMGFLDFAGGVVVHETSGVAALVAVLMIGPRIGFPEQHMPPHNVTLTMVGAGMLWVGWFGFNGGSALAADGTAGMAMLVTHISAATSAFAWLLFEWIRNGKPTVISGVTGMVAGLASITPASGYVGPAGALVIGLTAGPACYFATHYIKNVFKIDDSLDVFPVHCVGGLTGTLLAGVFAAGGLGIFSGHGLAEGMTIPKQFLVQLIGVIAVGAYTAIATFVLVKAINSIVAFRVTGEEEHRGLDAVSHHEHAYDHLTD